MASPAMGRHFNASSPQRYFTSKVKATLSSRGSFSNTSPLRESSTFWAWKA